MKIKSAMLALGAMLFVSLAHAGGEMFIYYSPTCPHCHHARDFVSNYLVYEYPALKVYGVNVMNQENRPVFERALKDCDYSRGGVPVVVIDGKCFQGFGTAETTGNEFRAVLNETLGEAAAAAAESNRAAMSENPDAFRAAHSDRANVVIDQVGAPKKNSGLVFWGVLIVLAGALAFVVLRKKKKK